MNSCRSYRWFQLRRTVNCHSDLPSPRLPNRTTSNSVTFSFHSFPFLSNATHQQSKKSIFAHVNRLNSLYLSRHPTLFATDNRKSHVQAIAAPSTFLLVSCFWFWCFPCPLRSWGTSINWLNWRIVCSYRFLL
jgi:hypothetical protein